MSSDSAVGTDPFPAPPVTTVPDTSGLVRAVRRRADLSQRQLARRAGLSHATVARIETRSLAPSLATLGAILEVAGIRLVAVDADNRVVTSMVDPPTTDLRDGAGRRYPSHLDVILDPLPGEWWADRYGMARPPETFKRDRTMRDVMRKRSVWEVRVEQNRWVPPPPTIEFWIQMQAACRRCGWLPPPLPSPIHPRWPEIVLAAATRAAEIAAGRGTGHGAARTPGPAPSTAPGG